jgi:hypothetical protein
VPPHEAKLREYEDLERLLAEGGAADDDGQLTALRAGIGHEQEWIRYWAGLADD